jgi:hypothetical protein
MNKDEAKIITELCQSNKKLTYENIRLATCLNTLRSQFKDGGEQYELFVEIINKVFNEIGVIISDPSDEQDGNHIYKN